MVRRTCLGLVIAGLVVFSAGIDTGLVWHRYLDPGSTPRSRRFTGRDRSFPDSIRGSAGDLTLTEQQRFQIYKFLEGEDIDLDALERVLTPEQLEHLRSYARSRRRSDPVLDTGQRLRRKQVYGTAEAAMVTEA